MLFINLTYYLLYIKFICDSFIFYLLILLLLCQQTFICRLNNLVLTVKFVENFGKGDRTLFNVIPVNTGFMAHLTKRHAPCLLSSISTIYFDQKILIPAGNAHHFKPNKCHLTPFVIMIFI